jgi:hypothetical protein
MFAQLSLPGWALRLIEVLLRAGYLEDLRYHRALSGAPQGGVVSPVLANMYSDRLDHGRIRFRQSPWARSGNSWQI